MDLSLESIQDVLTSNHVPETVLAAAGIAALLIVVSYLRNKEGLAYKFMVLVGMGIGVLLVIMTLGAYESWELYTTVIVIVAGFTLLVRPFRDLDFAIILALLVMAVVYVALGDLSGDLEVLSTGWPRIVATVVAGIISYMVLHFVQALVKLFGKLLNWWPVLLVLGLVCIAEAVALYQGYGSVYDYISSLTGSIA